MSEGRDLDLFVIGGGSGGVRAARLAAQSGARVAVAERSRYGGTCVIRGCVPKKLMKYAAAFSHDFVDSKRFGWEVGPASFDLAVSKHYRDCEIDRLEGLYQRNLQKAGARILHGEARFLDPHTIEIGGRTLTAETILIASGGHPTLPPGDHWQHAMVSDQVFLLDRLPERIAIVGGGYIGVEFAGIFQGLGSRVTLIHRDAAILRGFDEDLRDFVAEQMIKSGVDFRFGTEIAEIEPGHGKDGGAYRVTLSTGCELEVDKVLVATGRKPNTAELGLETVGVELDERGAVKVDAYSRTNLPHVYAVGDVTDRLALTPVAIREAVAFHRTVFEGTPTRFDYENVPSAVFSTPPLAYVGLSEKEALARHGAVDVYRSRYRALKHTVSGRDEQELIKLVVDHASGRVLGAHMVAEAAPEIIQGVAIAVRMGARKADFDATVGIHPTSAEEFTTLREGTTRGGPVLAQAAE